MRSPVAAESGGGASAFDVANSENVEMTGETEVQRDVGICPKFVLRDDARSRNRI